MIELAETQMTRDGVTKSRYWKNGWMLTTAEWQRLTAGYAMDSEPHVITPTKSGGIRKGWRLGDDGRFIDTKPPTSPCSTFTQTFYPVTSLGERFLGIRLHQLEKIAPIAAWESEFGDGILIGWKNAWLPRAAWERMVPIARARIGRWVPYFDDYICFHERSERYALQTTCQPVAEFQAA